MTLRRYSAYRESNLPWIDSAPEHWMISKLGHYFKEKPCYGVLVPDYELGGIPMIRITDMRNGKVNIEDLTTISSVLSAEYSRTIVCTGDVLLSVVGTIGEVVHVDKALEGVNLSRAVARIQVDRTHLEPKFLGWLLQSKVFSTYVDLVCVGSAQRVLNMGDLSAFATALPSMKEQSAITTFLDRETAKIDALIAEQEKLIALLAEKRQATISRAITRGLDQNVLLKDSGVPWLGKVPAHWEVRKISSISTKITNGYVGPTRDILVENGVRYLQSLHVKNNRIIFGNDYFVSEAWSFQHEKSILSTGDVLIVQTGDIGQVAVVTEEFSGCNCHALIIVSPLNGVLYGEWLSQVLNSSYGYHSLVSIQTGALHPHLNCGNVKNVYIPLPPLNEQADVILHINSQIEFFGRLESDALSTIVLLKERRAALISAAVTGKIDVRGLAA